MTSHAVVCDYDGKLLAHLENQDIVARVKEPGLVYEAVEVLGKTNEVQLLWLHGGFVLSDLHALESKNAIDIPIIVEVPDLGGFREWIVEVPLLRRRKVLVFLPESAPESYRNLRILSSLGVACGITFENKSPDWNSLADLLSYAVYGMVPHAPIQPFYHMISAYDPIKMTDMGRVYLEDPSRFLHIDAVGRIALSRKDLEKGQFISENCDALDEIEDMPAFNEHMEGWRNFFLKPEGCAYCPGWRVCQGKFEQFGGSESGCQGFFTELLEAAEFYKKQKEQHDSIRHHWIDSLL